MKNIIFIGSHLGYPMDRTPLGGGAMVGLQLVRHWANTPGMELTVLGSGDVPPCAGVAYERLPAGAYPRRSLVALSEFGYADFCRAFEKATTEWLLDRRGRFDPRNTVVIVNDISESPSLVALEAAGFPIVSLWHVDVVDYFNKLYLRGIVGPEKLTRLYERSRRFGMKRAVPAILRLVFDKQRETVLRSRRMIMPSRAMLDTVARCYTGIFQDHDEFARRALIVPWGVWNEPVDEAGLSEEGLRLRARYAITPQTRVIMTLSRISPEKGLHLLLKAARLLEQENRLDSRDICIMMCGEPAFMRGVSYMRKVRAAAQALQHVRVVFPGYIDARAKRAHFRIAQVFASPSIHESYGLNIVEAMQAGLPILASDHYGVRDIVNESFGRRVHYPSTAKAPPLLADALFDFLAMPAEKLAAMGRAAAAAAKTMPFSRAAQSVLDAALQEVN